jgi:hypothetical protein
VAESVAFLDIVPFTAEVVGILVPCSTVRDSDGAVIVDVIFPVPILVAPFDIDPKPAS